MKTLKHTKQTLVITLIVFICFLSLGIYSLNQEKHYFDDYSVITHKQRHDLKNYYVIIYNPKQVYSANLRFQIQNFVFMTKNVFFEKTTLESKDLPFIEVVNGNNRSVQNFKEYLKSKSE